MKLSLRSPLPFRLTFPIARPAPSDPSAHVALRHLLDALVAVDARVLRHPSARTT